MDDDWYSTGDAISRNSSPHKKASWVGVTLVIQRGKASIGEITTIVDRVTWYTKLKK